MTEPTLGEATRRFEEATKRLSGEMADLTRELREERRSNEQTYLRKDVYEAKHFALSRDVGDLQGEVENLAKARASDQDWRRQSSFQLAVVAGGWLLTIALAIFAFITR